MSLKWQTSSQCKILRYTILYIYIWHHKKYVLFFNWFLQAHTLDGQLKEPEENFTQFGKKLQWIEMLCYWLGISNSNQSSQFTRQEGFINSLNNEFSMLWKPILGHSMWNCTTCLTAPQLFLRQTIHTKAYFHSCTHSITVNVLHCFILCNAIPALCFDWVCSQRTVTV